MITFDGEWGLAMRLENTPVFPRNAALGCISDNTLIEAYGQEVARELREIGAHVNFAPDASDLSCCNRWWKPLPARHSMLI